MIYKRASEPITQLTDNRTRPKSQAHLTTMRIYMQTLHSAEQPLRYYHLHLQPDLLSGWNLVRESGIQGSRGQVTKEHFEERDEAERTLIKRRDMQLKRGYRVVFREGAPRDLNN
ncbi:WGR domain-containing protein [Sedimenticola selenatireducens]|nr:WGR domain-containing protein [Sedimenticola selenatireducens]